MRKLFVFAVCIALCIAMAVPAFAASKAKTPASDLKVIFEDDFSGDEIDTDNWFLCQGVKIVDGGMNFANDGNWINGGYSATYIPEDDYIENYVLDFDFTSNAQDCYFGVGVRAQSGGNSNFQNGGRFQVPSAAELGTGISFDLAISKNQNASAVGYIGVCLNNGGAYGDAPQFLVAYPDGFDGKSGHVTIVDLGDLITLYVNNVEVVTLTLSGSNVKAYNANGDEIFSTSEADYPDEGSFSFYQRNNSYRVDNVKVSEFKEGAAAPAGGLRDFAADKGDKMSYDQILVNGAEIANGNDAVIAAKALVDGSDGTIENVAMHGWYGNANSKIESFGYSIDGGDPVYGDFKVATTQDVIDAGGESRFTIVIDVTSLTDGETHKIQALAKLQNGDIVKLNRNADGKDRDAYVNYKAQLVDSTPNYALHGASFDTIYVNDVMNFGQDDGAASDKLDGVGRTIDGSDGSVQTIRIRGWIGFESEIDELGYQINGKNTFGDYKVAPEAAVTDPANGGQYATRFDMTIDVSNLKGTNNIVAVAKLADGTIVKIDENVSANGAGTTPNTSFTYIGPADENAQTGDMTVAMFAVIAVLALGAAVVFAKKRAF